MSTQSVVAQLRIGRNVGATQWTISGGEPTLRSDLAYLIRTARALGYNRVHLQTNGRAMSSQQYSRELIDAGVTKFIVSLHGHSPELHDRLTQVRGSYEETTAGLRNLIEILGAHNTVQTNTTIVIQNYRYLRQIVECLEELGVSQITLSYIQPNGSARAIIANLAPRMTDVAGEIETILERHTPRSRVTVDGIMPCLLARYSDALRNQMYTPARLLYVEDLWSVYQVMPEYEVKTGGQNLQYPAVLKIMPHTEGIEDDLTVPSSHYGSDCTSCRFRAECPGVWDYYVTQFGLDEFRMV